jgi:2,4-dienoyl-CoA reductase-like NADH-dependent reductase (Old Yellow Enzyme family)/thioredoxin reductase
MQFPNLFTPILINDMVSRNRIVATPIGDFFEEKALGGAGIVVCGHTIVDPGRSSFASPDEPYVFHKYSVEEARQRIRKCHQAGARASLELFHAGQYARVKDYAIGPMGFIREDGTEVRAMTPEMMQHAAACFAQAAREALDLGFDMVFLHFGHGWLPAQFLSPLFNKRADEYGGSFENRAKFPLLILQKVREAVGPKFPVDMRISAVEWVEGSIEFSDTLRFIKLAEPLIDTVQISAGLDINHEGNVHMVTTNFKGHMVNADYARAVKQSVRIPVSVVGAVMNPAEAEQLIADGTVDMVAFGRSFIADPDWPNKAKEGRTADIVPCIRCMYCYHISTERKNVGCSVNPRYRNEDFVPAKIEKADRIKRVVVVGGGPAGMSAAIAARQRGHEVVLFEKSNYLGGVLRYVEKEHYKEDIRLYLKYLAGQIQKSGADVRLNTAVTPALVRELKPDALFIAVGSLPVTPPIEGIHNKNVIGFYEAIESEDAIGQDVVIIGGGTIGAELGLELAELKGRNVTIVELTNKIATQGNLLYQIALRQKMDAVPTLSRLMETACEAITSEGVRVVSKDGAKHFIKADTVIVATGVAPNRALAESLLGITPDTFLIGDCDKTRKIMEAVFEGHTIASHL